MFMTAPVRHIALSAMLLAAFDVSMASASASCAAKAESIKQAQSEAETLRADRDALLVKVEDAGDVWEDTAAMRLFGASHAARATDARADYDALKAELITLEETLQANVADLNAEVASYNSQCATRR